ncbi:energy transducer TonB [Olivibacter sitiensis]|uniref:energy transducer TonB n=1 Tax=Olivibacter sitiensis TaxID=376470 RepID=UPI000683F83D|nr:energy transducer TonB [Olivibacter sitiensis]
MSSDWLELVFEGRNKLYGAYVMRKQANSDLTKALFAGMGLFLLGVVAPYLWGHLKPDAVVIPGGDVSTGVDLMPPIALEEKIIVPSTPAAAPAKARMDQVRMPRPRVVQAHMAVDEVPTVADLKKSNPGPKTIAGDPGADITIGVAVSESGKGQGITEGTAAHGGNEVMEHVEIMPSFPGGMAAFLDYVAKHYRIPSELQTVGVQGRIVVKFVVEKDGSLSGFEILKAIGKGTGEEAIRVLQSAPRWKPGIQNGRPVRVVYTLPIQLQLQ